MNNSTCSIYKKFYVLLIFFILLPGCSQQQLGPSLKIPPGVKKILVVSFRNMTTEKNGETGVRCPLTGKTFVTGEVVSGTEEFLTQELMSLVKEHKKFKLISCQEMWDIQPQSLTDGQNMPELKLLAQTGKKLGADAVIAGHVYRFKERVGRKYTAQSPASIAFDLHMVQVNPQRVLWSGIFDETQKPLTDNLFQFATFLKRDGQWITAKQMARTALEQMLEGIKP